jgi:capsid protein
MAEMEKYKICFGGQTKPIPFPNQNALVDWIYKKIREGKKPLGRIESIKLNGRVVAARTVLHIWRMVEQQQVRGKNTQAPTSC